MKMMNVKLRDVNWVPAIFLVTTPFIAVGLLIYFILTQEFHLSYLGLFAFFYITSILSISAGYHRLFAHRAYEVPNWLKFLYLFFGSAAFQNSAFIWAVDHRHHHRYVDTDQDPYSIKKGFWFAHFGWMLKKGQPRDDSAFSKDLLRDPLVMFQHKYYILIATFTCFVMPTFAGWLCGSAFAGLLFGGVLRLVFAHHFTFFINSACHWWGHQPFSDEHSARDSFILALFTFGEGYHNFHHEFQADYRNGVNWYDYDPSKWMISSLNAVGIVSKLKMASPPAIMKARVSMESKRLSKPHSVPHIAESLENLHQRLTKALERWETLRLEYINFKKEKTVAMKQRLNQLKIEITLAKQEFRIAYHAWKSYHSLVQSSSRSRY